MQRWADLILRTRLGPRPYPERRQKDPPHICDGCLAGPPAFASPEVRACNPGVGQDPPYTCGRHLCHFTGGGGLVLSKPFKAMFVFGGVARAFSTYQGCGFRRWSQDFSELEGGR